MSEVLNKYIDQAIKYGNVGPDSIADFVFRELTDQEKYELVKNLLHDAVRDRLRQIRKIPDVGANPRLRSTRVHPKINARYGNPDDRLNNILSGQFYTGSGWKQLRDMTYDDLMYAAKWRRTQADALGSEATRLENLAKLLITLDKPTVGSLPPGTLLRT